MENGGNYGRLHPGERFFPMDDELIVYYLKPLVHEKEVPGRGRLVFHYDLYQEPPSEIWDKFYVTRANDIKRSKSLYFFCRPEQVTLNGDKPGRIIRRLKCGGTWKENNEKKVISPETNTQIGYKKSFSYKKTPREKSNWIMHEFKLDPSQLLDKNLVNDYVLCVLRKKDDVQEEDDNNEEEELSEMHQPQHKRPRLVPSIDNYATSTQPTSQYSSIIGNPNPQQVQQISFYGNHYGMQYVSSGQVLQQQIPFYGDQNPYGMHHLSGQVQNLSQPFLIPSTTITTNAPLISSDQIDAEMYQCSYPSWCVENLNVDQPVAIHGSHAEISGEQGVTESYPYADMQLIEGSEKIHLELGEIDVHTYVEEFGNNGDSNVAKDSSAGEEILGQQTVISSCGGHAETEIGGDEERALKEFVDELEDMLTSDEEIAVNSADSNDVAEDNPVEEELPRSTTCTTVNGISSGGETNMGVVQQHVPELFDEEGNCLISFEDDEALWKLLDEME